MRNYPPVFSLNEQFRGCAYDLKGGAAVEIEEIGRGINGAEVTVDIKGMQICGPGDAVGGDCLDDVAFANVGFERGDMRAVAGAADVGGVGLVRGDGGLRRKGNFGREERGDCGLEDGRGGGVGRSEDGVLVRVWDFDDGSRGVRGDVKVGYYFYELVEVVKSDDGVEEHEEGFRDSEDVFHEAGGAWFEVPDTVIPDVANCTTG